VSFIIKSLSQDADHTDNSRNVQQTVSKTWSLIIYKIAAINKIKVTKKYCPANMILSCTTIGRKQWILCLNKTNISNFNATATFTNLLVPAIIHFKIKHETQNQPYSYIHTYIQIYIAPKSWERIGGAEKCYYDDDFGPPYHDTCHQAWWLCQSIYKELKCLRIWASDWQILHIVAPLQCHL